MHSILTDLYDEYFSLIEQKVSKKLLSASEHAKLEQLSYIKDKMNFLQKKAKSSIDAIYIIPDDIEDYIDALHLYNDLSHELHFILSHDFDSISPTVPSTQVAKHISENPDALIDSSISIPKVTKPKISLDDSKEEIHLKKNIEFDYHSSNKIDTLHKSNLDYNHKENISVNDNPKKVTNTNDEIDATNSSVNYNSKTNNEANSTNSSINDNPNFKLFQDLADIDRILGNISFNEQNQNDSLPNNAANNKNPDNYPLDQLSLLTNDLKSQRQLVQNKKNLVSPSNSKFFIGSIVSPSYDVTSYNDSSVVAKKDSKYRIVSFVALDSSDIVVDSSSSFGLSFRDFSSSHPSSSTLFILSKEPKDSIDFNSWASRDISLDLPLCIGSFSNLSSFSSVSL